MSSPRLIDCTDIADSNMDWAFTHFLWELNGEFYYLVDPEKRRDPESVDFSQAELVPRSYCQVPVIAGIQRAGDLDGQLDNIFLKRFIPYGYMQEYGTEQGSMLDHEARIYEIIQKAPHPRICTYYGYVSTPDGQYIDALCLKKYDVSLSHAVWEKRKLDVDVIMEGVKDGLGHLHSLGLAHNDLSPANIMLDSEGLPVIVDFDSCRRIGEEIGNGKGGSFPWAPEPMPRLSLVETDWYVWQKIRDWLIENNQVTN